MAGKFINAATNGALTANGAVAFKTTLDPVLDLFSNAGAMRSKQSQVETLFAKAFAHDPLLALKAMFHTRDIRGGKGERETFRTMLRWLYNNDSGTFSRIVSLVAEYGRWDDLIEYTGNSTVINIIRTQFNKDLSSDRPSLLAKWMPSENASSKETKRLARAWMRNLRMSPDLYRTNLSMLRARIRVVEALMSAGKWDKINYEQVPSLAMTNYRSAFGRRDTDRFGKYLASVEKGEKKINASVSYPSDLYKKVMSGGYDRTLEAQWSALPNYMVDGKTALVMADVSGSMSGDPIAVSVALALYAAERAKGPFANHFMTFSNRPALVEIKGKTLYEKMQNINRAQWDMNTNLDAGLDMILNIATRNKLDQSDLPDMLFIISDMQFDASGCGNTNFERARKRFSAAGYKLPTVVFWNVRAVVGTSPVTEKETGVYLVSGYSPSIFKSALTAKAITPLDMMLEVLNGDRYAAVEVAYNG